MDFFSKCALQMMQFLTLEVAFSESLWEKMNALRRLEHQTKKISIGTGFCCLLPISFLCIYPLSQTRIIDYAET